MTHGMCRNLKFEFRDGTIRKITVKSDHEHTVELAAIRRAVGDRIAFSIRRISPSSGVSTVVCRDPSRVTGALSRYGFSEALARFQRKTETSR